jgi:MYND finger
MTRAPENFPGKDLVRALPEIEAMVANPNDNSLTLRHALDEDIWMGYWRQLGSVTTLPVVPAWKKLVENAAPGSSPRHVAIQTKLYAKLVFLLFTNHNHVQQKGITMNGLLVSEEFRWVFLKVMDAAQEEIIDICYDGEADPFQSHRAAVYATNEQFRNNFYDVMIETYSSSSEYGCSWVEDKLQDSLSEIRLGLQKYSIQTCWECGKKSKYYCPNCRAAQYCSRSCQEADWKRHKQVCLSFKELFDRFQEWTKTVDEAFAEPDKHRQGYGFLPSVWDYYAALRGIEYSLRQSVSTLPGPSMINFYNNLQLVSDGELWMETKEEEEAVDDSTTARLVVGVCVAMMFDYAFVEERSKEFQTMAMRFCGMQSDWGMTAKKWVTVYRKGQDASTRARYRQINEVGIYELFKAYSRPVQN